MKIGLVNFDIDPYLVQFAEKFSKKYHIESFMGYRKPKSDSPLIKSDFLDATALYHVEDFGSQYSEELFTKDREYYLKYFILFSKIMDRVSPNLHSSNYKELYFWKLIDFFSNYINKKKIDLLLFDVTPHRPWDFVLLLVAKKFNMKILIFKRTEIIGKNLIVEDFEKEKINFNFEYKYQKEDKIFSKILDEKKYSQFKDYLRSKDTRDGLEVHRFKATNNLKILSKKNIFFYYFYKISLFLKIIEIKYVLFDVMFKKLPIQKVGATENSNPNTTLASLKKITKLDYFFIKNKVLKRNNIINKINNNNNFKINDMKYIFFALPFQPERTTLPESGLNNSVINSLKYLSSNLPENLKILVKEHPRQLYKDVRTFHFRDKSFYKELLDIKNVVLVNAEENYHKLITNSVLTSALCGSIIFDGLLSGKPSIVFGNTWLSDCESIHEVNFNQEIKSVISKFLKKNQDDVKNEFFDFLKKNQKYLVNAAVTHKEIERFNLDEKRNIDDLLLAVTDRIEKF